ncbi:MAG: fluoride efflux transporter CrcB [Xanthomonadales bacterium]|nr:fluoride efflux transporter CrcB [Xanthomonadales bacterium]
MSITAFAAVAIGAVFGAWLRWGLATLLNPICPNLALGTLAANLLGGLLIGLVLGSMAHFQSLAPAWRLGIVTGFLGALTTFSTFSAQATNLLLRQQYAWFAGQILVHVAGSLAMTLIGIGLIRTFSRV